MLLLVHAVLAALPPPGALATLADPAAARDVFKHAPRGPIGAALPSALPGATAPAAPPSASDTGWDIEDYVLAVRIDPDAQTVTGHATIAARRVGEGDLVFHADGPVLGAVRVDGLDVTPLVDGDEQRIALPGGSDTAIVTVDWTYDGAAPNGIQWDRNVIFSFHEPSGARTWLPVYDHPSDKATLTWEVTAPDGWVVAANGVLEGQAPADAGWTTWRYTLAEPIATYLMTVHLSDRYVLSVTEGDIPVYTWAYPDRQADVDATFGTTAEMLAFFSERYAPYPFPSYGNAMAPFGSGAMEHTTCVTFADSLVGAEAGELVNAHELGHHWWGNDVTLGDWADIWLNEGFATYTEALWYEHAYGAEGLTTYVDHLTAAFFEWQGLEGRFPVYDPLYMWGGVVYDKGALIVHMLRGVLGDDAFFAALAAYEAEHHLGTAVTTDLVASFEASSGADLDWFFDQWVYGIGEPTYTWAWAAQSDGADGWQLDLSIAQDLPAFRMPVPLRVDYADGTSEDVTVVVEGESVRVSRCVTAEPVAVTLDPDLWVLRAGEVVGVGVPGPLQCGPDAGALDPLPEAGLGCGCNGSGAVPRLGVGVLVAMGLLARRRR